MSFFDGGALNTPDLSGISDGIVRAAATRDKHRKNTAKATMRTAQELERVILALNASLEVARNAKEDADRAQRLSTGIAIASLAIAGASMVVAIIAVIVTLN
ncbi:hypothetical protein [Leifsonia sp. Root112D2]|uniref:hypothetical protein n=1 Tax=Leifsonia sp. Root112D2 TaxID=1736426 RepID=UPI0006F5E273|nr:hypothetical protein [Leifsonia sp. Root112D2]KQV05013.1 hypothetical protein ASC63_14425 [Leifsonia sp. Root112D2]